MSTQLIMTNPTRLFRVALAGAAMFIAACGSDSPSGPGTPGTATFNLAGVLAEIGRGTPTAARAEMGSSASITGSTSLPAACTYVPSSQTFACPAQISNGVTVTMSYMLLDAAGHPQSAADVATTAAVRTITTVSGTLTLQPSSSGGTGGTLTLNRTDDMTLSGLLTGVHTLNGTGNGTSETKVTLAGQLIDVTSADKSTTTNVVLPKASSTSFWPVSGTITSDQTLTSKTAGFSGLTSTIHSVMTFNGSANMTVSITIDGVTSTCTINLQDPGSTVCSA
jgi:hypothetical protein